MIGQVFNRWTIINSLPKCDHRKIWECKCECGVIKPVYEQNLKNGHSKSCGCYARDKTYTGYKDISGTFWARIVIGAKNRKLEFSITLQDAWTIFIQQKKQCALSGADIEFSLTTKDYWNNKTTASLDRIDSTKGYTVNNIQWVHKDINRMKWNLDQEHFINLCMQVTNNATKSNR